MRSEDPAKTTYYTAGVKLACRACPSSGRREYGCYLDLPVECLDICFCSAAAGPQHSNLTFRSNNKTPGPIVGAALLKQFTYALNQISSTWGTQTHQQDAVVRTWGKSPRIREIQVLGDQKSRFLLRGFPNLAVSMADQPLIAKRMNVVTVAFQHGSKLERKILVQLNLHRMRGTAGTGKSSSAEAAANAMAA